MSAGVYWRAKSGMRTDVSRASARMALVQDFLDRPLAAAVAVLPVFPDIGDVKKRGALEADLDESALHARQDPGDAPEIDVADEAARAGSLHVELLHHALLEHGHARF